MNTNFDNKGVHAVKRNSPDKSGDQKRHENYPVAEEVKVAVPTARWVTGSLHLPVVLDPGSVAIITTSHVVDFAVDGVCYSHAVVLVRVWGAGPLALGISVQLL